MTDEIKEEPKAPAPKSYNPPKGWKPKPVPTAENEEELLELAFGKPDANGVYAPRTEA